MAWQEMLKDFPQIVATSRKIHASVLHMAKPITQQEVAVELELLGVGQSLRRPVNLEKRQRCYDAAKTLGIKLCIQAVPLKVSQFRVTRIA